MKNAILENAQNLTWLGAIGAGLGFLSITEWLALGGFALALIGAVVNVWYKYKLVQIEQLRLKHEIQTK